jgi:hypothetical protein
MMIPNPVMATNRVANRTGNGWRVVMDDGISGVEGRAGLILSRDNQAVGGFVQGAKCSRSRLRADSWPFSVSRNFTSKDALSTGTRDSMNVETGIHAAWSV